MGGSFFLVNSPWACLTQELNEEKLRSSDTSDHGMIVLFLDRIFCKTTEFIFQALRRHESRRPIYQVSVTVIVFHPSPAGKFTSRTEPPDTAESFSVEVA